MPRPRGLTIFAVAAFLGLPAQGQPIKAPPVPDNAVRSMRCDDWKKVGEHRWMVVKEVMLGAARRAGTILQSTPETDALDAKCPG